MNLNEIIAKFEDECEGEKHRAYRYIWNNLLPVVEGMSSDELKMFEEKSLHKCVKLIEDKVKEEQGQGGGCLDDSDIDIITEEYFNVSFEKAEHTNTTAETTAVPKPAKKKYKSLMEL